MKKGCFSFFKGKLRIGKKAGGSKESKKTKGGGKENRVQKENKESSSANKKNEPNVENSSDAYISVKGKDLQKKKGAQIYGFDDFR